jgi:DNA-binding MarR family transcriptional regulator
MRLSSSKGESAVTPDSDMQAAVCNCLALRQAARHVTRLYDQSLAPAGLRATQFSILSKLKRLGPLTVNALAAEMAMDRTTLGRTMLPLERDGLIAIESGAQDRRSKELQITRAGARRLDAARALWAQAQKRFEAEFGSKRASSLRSELRAIVAGKFA